MLFRISFFSILAMFSSLDLRPMSLERICLLPIKDTFSHLAPCRGVLYWESGIIKRCYKYLPFQRPEKGCWLGDNDGITRTLHALFTSVLNEDDIDVSDNPSFVGKHLQPSTIGKIIATIDIMHKKNLKLSAVDLEKSIINEPGFAQSIATTLETRKQLAGQLPVTLLNRFDTTRLYRDYQRIEKIRILEQRKTELSNLTGKQKQNAQKELNNINNNLQQLRSAESGGDYNRVREFAQAVIDATALRTLHATNMALPILLAFLYRKIKTFADLNDYAKAIEEILGETIIDDKAVIPPTPISVLQEQLQNLLSAPVNYDCICAQLHKQIIYTQLLTRFICGAYPKKAEYASVAYHGHNFSDCVETLIRNLCNRILYCKESGCFEYTKAPNSLTDPSFIAFLQDMHHKRAINVEDSRAYSDWLAVVENKPWIAYRRKIETKNNKANTIIATNDSCGFIKGIPSTVVAQCTRNCERIKLGNYWYILVENEEELLYEMEPSLHNIIITLDRLFNMHIFEHPIEQEFLRSDFVTYYLPKLCEHLAPLNTMNTNPSLLNLLETTEYSEQIREIYFDGFRIMLARSDADIIISTPHDACASISGNLVAVLNNTTGDTSQTQKIHDLLTIFHLPFAIIPPNLLPQLLFWLDLDDPAIIANLFEYFFIQKTLAHLQPQHREQTLQIAALLLKKLPRRFDWRYHTTVMSKLDPAIIEYKAIRKAFDELVLFAERCMSGPAAAREELINFFEALVIFRCYHLQIRKALVWFMENGSDSDRIKVTTIQKLLQ